MKAVRVLQYGGQLVFDDVPTPTIARDEILTSTRRMLRRRRTTVTAVGRPNKKARLVQHCKNLRARHRIDCPEPDAFLNRDVQTRRFIEFFTDP